MAAVATCERDPSDPLAISCGLGAHDVARDRSHLGNVGRRDRLGGLVHEYYADAA
jgi:hypothetical protein